MSYRPPLIVSLLMRRGPQPNRVFPLDKEIITIGRGPDNDIVVDDAEVSRHHARLTRRGHDWILKDLGSRNGTFVNGQRLVGPVMLMLGAQVGLGSRVLFSLEMGLPVAPAPLAYAPPRRKGGFNWLFVAAPVAILVFLLGVLAALLYLRQREQARAEFEPPTVLVTEPLPGASAFAGSYLPVSATAFGRHPITRAELWLDGELKETQNSSQPGGEPTFYASFNLLVLEGPHMLFVRAVNAAGVVGQSYPVSIAGIPKPGPEQVFWIVRAGTGETLADIASSYDTDVATLQRLNPNLGGQEPAADAVLRVPAPPDEEPPAASPPSPPAPGSSPKPIPAGPPLQVAKPPPFGIHFDLPLLLTVLASPATPTGLEAQVKDCKVTLRWNDNATNEFSYEVWMAGLGSPPRVIAKLQPATSGLVWFELPAPQPGFFSFWVEAVNSLGRQPSNIVWVLVDPKCPAMLATHLQVEALDMTVGGNQDRVYCYVSFEGAPETRLPTDLFIEVKAGKADLASWPIGSRTFAIPIPGDGALEISGECWGWAGKTLNKLGSFSGKFATETWDGARRSLEGGAFQIGLAIKPLGVMDTTGTLTTYKYEDPSLPVPYDVKEEHVRSVWGNVDPRERVLTWKWDGDAKKIDGFKIYLNGEPYNLGWLKDVLGGLTAPADARQVEVRLPAECGKHIRWQVSAYKGEAESKLSATAKENDYDQLKCPVYVVVTFDSIRFDCTVDGWGSCQDGQHCDQLDSYYHIRVNDKPKDFWGGAKYGGCKQVHIPIICDLFPEEPHVGGFYMPIKCGSYTFQQLAFETKADPYPNIIVVPIDTETIKISVEAEFWDQDDWSADDLISRHYIVHEFPSLQKAQEALVTGNVTSGCSGKSFVDGPSQTDTGTSYLYYTLMVWPNQCGEKPHTP